MLVSPNESARKQFALTVMIVAAISALAITVGVFFSGLALPHAISSYFLTWLGVLLASLVLVLIREGLIRKVSKMGRKDLHTQLRRH